MRPSVLVAPLAVVCLISACHHAMKNSTVVQAPPPPTRPAVPAGVTPQLIAMGDSLFAVRACQRCHGPKGTGGTNGPDLTVGPWLHVAGNYDELVQIITTGVPKAELKNPTRPFAMNPRGGGPVQLTDDQIKAIAAYVWTISRNKTKV